MSTSTTEAAAFEAENAAGQKMEEKSLDFHLPEQDHVKRARRELMIVFVGPLR